MANLPSLTNMHPGTWVQTMRELRNSVADQAANVLDDYSDPTLAKPKLQAIFDEFTRVDINAPMISRLESRLSIEIKIRGEHLVFWVFPTEQYQTLVYTDADCWWLDHQGAQPAGAGRHQIHRQLVLRLLALLPWANDDDLSEIAAIEIASRAG